MNDTDKEKIEVLWKNFPKLKEEFQGSFYLVIDRYKTFVWTLDEVESLMRKRVYSMFPGVLILYSSRTLEELGHICVQGAGWWQAFLIRCYLWLSRKAMQSDTLQELSVSQLEEYINTLPQISEK